MSGQSFFVARTMGALACLTGCFILPELLFAAPQDFKPSFEQVFVTGLPGGREIRVESDESSGMTITDYIPGLTTDKTRIDFLGNEFVGKNTSGVEIWRIKRQQSEHADYRFLANTSDEALFSAWPKPRGSRVFESPPRLYRLHLPDGTWRDPLPLPDIDLDEGLGEFILGATTDGDRKIVFSTIVINDPKRHENGNQTGFRVTCFDKMDQRVWSKHLPSSGHRQRPGAFIIGGGGPASVDGRPSLLNVHGDRLFVCGSEKDDVVALNLEDGEILWRVPRIWEFRRGFTGPSVWSHHLGRYGFQSWDLESLDKESTLDSKAAREYHQGLRTSILAAKKKIESENNSIVAGPFVVPTGGTAFEYKSEMKEIPELSIFVVTAISDDRSWPGYLSDCVVYEFNQSGEPVGIATIPRMVARSGHKIVDQGIILRCQSGGMVRIGVTDRNQHRAGIGGSDMLCPIEWYREISDRSRNPWLMTPPGTGQIVYNDQHAFFLADGGFVDHDDKQLYKFPVRMMNLETGIANEFLLTVPFEGNLVLPEVNFSRRGESTRLFSPFKLLVTVLELEPGTLNIVLGSESERKLVKIPLGQLAGTTEPDRE